MKTADLIILMVSVLGLIVMAIILARDKNKPVGYRFTDPDDLSESSTDNDEDNNLGKK